MHSILNIQKQFLGQILTIAETSLPPTQFRAFKKLILKTYHDDFRPRLVKTLKDQVRAVPLTDNLDGKEAAMTLDPKR